MQPPTQQQTAAVPARRGDEDELYRRHHRELHRAVAHVVRAPRELIEDACQAAWTILLCRQPDRYAIFGWLRVVAIHEAYRLSAIERRDARLERLRAEDGDWQDVTADPGSLEDASEALEALRVLASLPERQRNDLARVIAGYSYAEIRQLTPGRTAANVNSPWSRLVRGSGVLTLTGCLDGDRSHRMPATGGAWGAERHQLNMPQCEGAKSGLRPSCGPR